MPNPVLKISTVNEGSPPMEMGSAKSTQYAVYDPYTGVLHGIEPTMEGALERLYSVGEAEEVEHFDELEIGVIEFRHFTSEEHGKFAEVVNS